MPLVPRSVVLRAALASLAILSPLHAAFQVPETLTPEQAARFERFKDFRILGVCNTLDMERLARFGVNTVRGYSIKDPKETVAELDRAHALGMKVIVSEWMPHHGANKGDWDSTWNFDYNAKGDELIAKFLAKVDVIGDHPALLMWGLGNEVHIEEPYLRVVNRMSRALHERFPHHLTSLTIVNAKPEQLALIKEFAPDIDVIGGQSYSVGAVRGTVRNLEQIWGRPFYMSEFNGNGPWNFGKTPWGEAYDEPVAKKVADIKACYDVIDASSLCLGSTIFAWGWFNVDRPTYFSLLLADDPARQGSSNAMRGMMMTPQAEAVVERFTGRPPEGNRAPVLTKLALASGERHASVVPEQPIDILAEATDANGDTVTYQVWVLDSKPQRPRVVGRAQRFESGTMAVMPPKEPGTYLAMVYALDGKGGASASTIPFEVKGAVDVAPAR